MDISNKAEVKRAEKAEKDRRKQELNDLRTTLSNASGRRLLWRLMGYCKTFESVFSVDSLVMARNAGQQDLGHFIMSEIVSADENLLLKLMKENKQEKDHE